MTMEEISQIKPRLGQGRAGLRHKIKIPILINKPIAQTMKIQSKVLAPKSPTAQDKVIPISIYATPQMKHKADAS